MATIWQYATLSAGERLSRIRAGESDVYTQEIARSNQVIKDRQAIGLDISEQLAWIQKLDYVRANNGPLTLEEVDYNSKTGKTVTPLNAVQSNLKNLQSASNLNNSNISNIPGINSGNIGNIISGGNNSGISNSTAPPNVPVVPQLPQFNPAYINANYEQELKEFMGNQQKRRDDLEVTLRKELDEKYGVMESYYGQINETVEKDTLNMKSDYYANALSRLPSMYEKFANSGLSFDGGRVRSEQMSYNNALNKSLATLDAQALHAINTNNLSKATEKNKAYSEYTGRLAQENARLDDIQYQMMRDLQDNALRQQQFAWDQYKYCTQYEFDRYKYEQQLRESAEQKTLEQLRWEKEFGFKIDALEFDKLLKQNQLSLETDRYMFDRAKYEQEYMMKQQEYDLKIKQYHDDLYFRQQDYAMKAQEFALKVDLTEFNKMLDSLKYSFDISKFEKEYALKQNSQNFDLQKFEFDIERFYKEYEFKQQQSDRDYDFKVNQSNIGQMQWEREMALKEMIEKSKMTQAEKDYALKYLDLEKKYSQTPTSSANTSSSNASNSSNNNANSNSSGTTTLYDAALTTAMWMKTQYSNNGKNTVRKFTDNDIDNWINTLQLSSADKARLKKAVGI